jgi:hypothetical protein
VPGVIARGAKSEARLAERVGFLHEEPSLHHLGGLGTATSSASGVCGEVPATERFRAFYTPQITSRGP